MPAAAAAHIVCDQEEHTMGKVEENKQLKLDALFPVRMIYFYHREL